MDTGTAAPSLWSRATDLCGWSRQSAHVLAHAQSDDLLALRLVHRAPRIAEVARQAHGVERTTSTVRVDRAMVELTLTVAKAAKTGFSRESYAFVNELVLASLNARLVARYTRGPNVILRYRAARRAADDARGAARRRGLRRRLTLAMAAAGSALSLWRLMEGVEALTRTPDQDTALVTLAWFVMSGFWLGWMRCAVPRAAA